MPEKVAKVAEIGGHGSTVATASAGLGMWASQSVNWLNDNSPAILAICAITTCIVGCYGTIARIRLARQQRRRETDE